MKYIVAVLLLGSVAWGLMQLGGKPVEPPRTQSAVVVEAYTLQPQEFADRAEVLGSLLGKESVTITANTTETVSAIHFREGQTVDAGQLLVTLDQAEERAQLDAAKADFAEQQREVKRLQGLVKTMVAAQTDLDQRRTALAKAKHKIEELEATISDRTLVAPFAGVLGLRLVSPGALVTPGTVITTLDDIDPLRLDFSVPVSLLATLKPGLELRARTTAYDRDFSGRITVIDSRVNVEDRSIRARAEFANPEGLLKPGMLMSAELLSNPRQSLLVPEAALLSRDHSHSVWLINADKQLERRQVEIGGRRPGWVEITAGLNPGDTIVGASFPRLREGLPVSLLPEAS